MEQITVTEMIEKINNVSIQNTNLLKEWKKKCGLQALISYKSSIYYSVMNCVFGIPPMLLTSIATILKTYPDRDPYTFNLTELIFLITSTVLGTIHFYCNYGVESKQFRDSYNKYSCLKRKIELYETLDLKDKELYTTLVEIKNEMENIKQGTSSPPWIIYRQFDEIKELEDALKMAEEN